MAILELLDSKAGSSITEGNVDAYLEAVAPYSAEAVAMACKRYLRGEVPGHDIEFLPTAGAVASQARMLESALNAGARRAALPPGPPGYRQLPDGSVIVPIGAPMPEGYAANGLLEVDLGEGKIDLRGKTPAEKRAILEQHGEVDVKRVAGGGFRQLPRIGVGK